MTTSYIRGGLTVAIFLLGACGLEPLSVSGSPSRTLSVAVGQELNVALQTIGPGEYEVPPAISSPSLRFIDVALVTPHVPAGPTQRFRFRAESRGQAIILFRHSGNNSAVSDTVEVR